LVLVYHEAGDDMVSGSKEASTATMWQLQVLVAAVELEDWALVEQRLGVDRYRCRRAIDRLAMRLGVEKLIGRVGDRMIITPRDRDLAQSARRILETYEEMRVEAGGTSRGLIMRFAAYPAHLKAFAARAAGETETLFPNLRVEFQDLEGRRRRGGGVTTATQLRDRTLDIAIAACNFNEDVPDGLSSEDLYGWRLMVVDQSETMARSSPKKWTKVQELRGKKLLVAPKGHRSRDLLDLFADQTPPWEVVGEGEDPEVLADIARYSNKLAIIPTDSLASRNVNGSVLVAPSVGALGGKYRVLWRRDDSPARLAAAAHALAGRLFDLSEPLREGMGGDLHPTRAEVRLRHVVRPKATNQEESRRRLK
jgi:DNA-binding transcriptional LysR family regulator